MGDLFSAVAQKQKKKREKTERPDPVRFFEEF